MPTPTPIPPSSGPAQEYVGFECHLCQTRMYVRPKHVGKIVKCPDCGAKTQVPQPTAPRAKRLPTALEGEQYELWDADAAPLPSELRAAEPIYIAIECRMCQTLFYGTLEQVGQPLKCPDCGTKHVVPPPKPAAKPKHRLADDGEEIALDETAAPSERPVVVVPPRRPLLYEEEAERDEHEREKRAAKRGNRATREVDNRGRPVMPRFPLVTGIVPFLCSPGVPVRWGVLSAVAALTALLATFGASSIGAGGGIVSTGMNAIGGVCFFVIGCIVFAFWLAGLASIVLAIIVESSDGNRHVYQWPPANPVEWLPQLIHILIAGFVCFFPGWLIARFVPGAAEFGPLLIGGSALLALPIILLSQLELDSPFAVVSGHVLASLAKCLLSWALFYAELAAIAAICIAAAAYVTVWGEAAMYVLIPLYVAAILLSARLLGRLAWKLAEATAIDEPGGHDRSI